MSQEVTRIKNELKKYANKDRAMFSPGFFKTGEGEYGEGDVFRGLKVGDCRKLAKQFFDTSFNTLELLLHDEVHEIRLLALFILIEQYHTAVKNDDRIGQKKVIDFYLAHLEGVNNRDLVDSSAYKLLGHYLLDKPRVILYKYADSKVLWIRRIAIIATYAFIKEGDVKDTYSIATMLLNDEHDLMHKAVGWMLREAGKKDEKKLRRFLEKHAGTVCQERCGDIL